MGKTEGRKARSRSLAGASITQRQS